MCRCSRISRSSSSPASICRRHSSPGSRTWPSSWDRPMATLTDMIAGELVHGHGGCPRVVVSEDGWRFATSQLSAGYWTLLGLWGDTGAVHMTVLEEGARKIAVITLLCPNDRFPSVGAVHAPAVRLERAIQDL